MFFDCPRCHGRVLPAYLGRTRVMKCSKCSGLVISTSAMHLRSGQKLLAGLYRQAETQPRPSRVTCSSCRKPMRVVHSIEGGQRVELDVCVACHLFWLDTDELAKLPGKSFEQIEKEKAREEGKGRQSGKSP